MSRKNKGLIFPPSIEKNGSVLRGDALGNLYPQHIGRPDYYYRLLLLIRFFDGYPLRIILKRKLFQVYFNRMEGK